MDVKTIIKGDSITVVGYPGEWGVVVSRTRTGFLADFDGEEWEVDLADVADHRTNGNAPLPKDVTRRDVGKFVEDNRGRLYKLTGWGTKNAQMVDEAGRSWRADPRLLRHTHKSFNVADTGKTRPVLGSVVVYEPAAKRWGLAKGTRFVVVKVGNGTVNLVVLGGNPPSSKYAYFRTDSSAVKVVTP